MANDNDLRLIFQPVINTSENVASLNEQIKQLTSKLNSLNLNVVIDTQNLNKLTGQFEVIQKQVSQIKTIQVVDKNQIADGQKLYSTMKDVVDEYSKLGTVKVTNSSLNPITKELQGFSIQVENADKNIEKLKFDLMHIADGDSINKMFTATKLNETDSIAAKLKEQERLANQMADGRIKEQEKFANLQKAQRQKEIDDAHLEANESNNLANQMAEFQIKSQERIRNDKRQWDNNQQSQIQKNAELEREEIAKSQASRQKYQDWWLKSLKEQDLAEEKSYQKRLADLKDFQDKSEIMAKNLSRRYGSSIDIQGLNNNLAGAQSLSIDDKDFDAKKKNIVNGFKEIESSAKTMRSNFMSMQDKFAEALRSFPVWIAASTLVMGGLHAVINGFKEGIVEVDAKMAGYVQTNEAYFNTEQKVIAQTHEFIQTTHQLGAEIGNVLESARLYGRMYKDVEVVQELVRQSTKLSTVDLVSLGDATKGMEAILAQYHAQLRNVNDAQVIGNQLLDSFSKVAHDSAIPARDLLMAYERMGSVAHDTGVSVDFMNGLLASGFRNTALSGENLGNMWKTVLGNLHSDKAVSELERLGVATKVVVNGVEQWKKAEDILLDLSVKVIGKNEDLTKSYEDIARGVFQYQKLAASIDLGSIIQAQAASINSTGSTTEYLKTRLDTIEIKAKQVHASFIELFNTAGDDGLRSSIKGILDVIDQLLIGTTQMSKGTFEATAILGGLGLAYLALKNPIVNVIEAVKLLNLSKTTTIATTIAENIALSANIGATEKIIVSSSGATLAKVSEAAAIQATTVAISEEAVAAASATVATALWTGGISLAVGLLAVLVMSLGSAKKAEQDANIEREKSLSLQEQEYGQLEKQIGVIPKWVSIHNELTKALESGTLSAEGQSKAKNDLDKVSKALADTIGQEGYSQLKAADFTDEATKRIVNSIIERQKVLKSSMLLSVNEESTSLSDREYNALLKRNEANQKLDSLKNATSPNSGFGGVLSGSGATDEILRKDGIKKYQKQLDEASKELADINKSKLDVEGKKLTIETDLLKIDQLGGSDGKDLSSTQTADDAKKSFQDKMSTFNHLVAIQADGYTNAADKIKKLTAIKNDVKGALSESDLYSIDEEIYKLQNPKETKGIASDITLQASETKRDMNSYARDNRSLDSQLVESEANLSKLKDTSKAYRDELEKQIPIYKQKQDLAHQEADDIRAVNREIQFSLDTEKLSASNRNALLNQLDSNQTKITQLSKSWFDYGKTIEDLSKKDSLSVVNETIKKLSDNTSEFDEKIKNLKTAMSSLKTDPSEKIKDQGELIKTYAQEQESIIKSVASLKEKASALDKNSEGYIKLQEEITKYGDKYNQINADVESLNQKIATETIDIIKKSLQSRIDAEKSVHDAKIKNLDEEMKKQDDATNAAIQAIDRQQQAIDANKTLDKDQDALQKLQNERNAYLIDTSNEGKSKVAELDQKIAEQKEKIADEEQKRQNELVKQSLQDANKVYKTDIENKKAAEDKKTQTVTDSLNEQINNDQHWLDLQKQMLDGHTTNVGNEIKTIIDDLGNFATTNANIVGAHVTAVKSMIDQLKSSSIQLGQISSNSSIPSGGVTGSYTPTGTEMSYQDKLAKAGIDDDYAISLIKDAKQKYEQYKTSGNMDKANAAHSWADQIRSANPRVGSNPLYMGTGGYTGDGEGLAYLHSKELVLSKFDTSNILKVVDFTRDIMSKIKTPDFSNIIPKMAGVGGNTFNANFGNINITGDKQGGETAINTIVNGLKRLGVNTL